MSSFHFNFFLKLITSEILEVYQFNLEDKKSWTYRIVRPDCLGEYGGGHGAGWLIWEEIGTDITQNI